jgi:hypothetical protein
MITGILFNGTDLTALPGVSFTYRDIHDLANRNLNSVHLARKDGMSQVSAEYANKTIQLTGFITGTDRGAMEQARDGLLAVVTPRLGNLDIPMAGSTRRFVATLANFTLTDKEGGAFDVFTLTFDCVNPFSSDTTATAIGPQTITTASATIAFTPGGSFYAQPQLTLTYNSLGPNTTDLVTLSNPLINAQLVIERTFTVGDVMVVDFLNRTVTVNGTAVDYQGAFTIWNAGVATTINYSDTFGSRSVVVSGSYYKRWL